MSELNIICKKNDVINQEEIKLTTIEPNINVQIEEQLYNIDETVIEYEYTYKVLVLGPAGATLELVKTLKVK